MRNSIVFSVMFGLLTIAQADPLDSHIRLDMGKIHSVLPRNANQDQNEDGNKNGKASKQKIDAQELAAASDVATIDAGETCGRQTTVIVTETAAGVAAAVVTGLDSGTGRNKTSKDTKSNKKNQDQNGGGRTGNKNADSGKDSGGGRNKGSQKDQGNVVQILTIDISGNNGDNNANAQGNDKTVTVTKTEVVDNGKANKSGDKGYVCLVLNAPLVTNGLLGSNSPSSPRRFLAAGMHQQSQLPQLRR